MLVYGFDTPSTDVDELRETFDNGQPQECKRETNLKSCALAEFPHIFFLVVPNETSRSEHGSSFGALAWREGGRKENLRPKPIDFPQEIFHSDSVPPSNIGASLEEVTMDDRAFAEPAPSNFSESLLSVVLTG